MSFILQKRLAPNSGEPIWIVLVEDYAPVEPIQKYLNHLVKIDRTCLFAPYTQMPWREAKAEMERLNS